MSEEEITVFECSKCLVILPYKSCYHSCLEQDLEDEEEGFMEDLTGWYLEVKNKKDQGVKIKVVEADGTVNEQVSHLIVMIVPNQPGQQYPQKITGHDLDGSWHLRRNGEQIPQGVDPILMVEVSPGQYRKLSAIEVEEEQQEIIEKSRVSLEELMLEDQPRFEDLFQHLREPFP